MIGTYEKARFVYSIKNFAVRSEVHGPESLVLIDVDYIF